MNVISIVTWLWILIGGLLAASLSWRTLRHLGRRASAPLVSVGVAVLFVVLAPQMPATWRADLTRSQSNTLSRASLQLLDRIHEPVRITAFFDERSGAWQDATRLLGAYDDRPGVEVRIVDPDVQSGLALEYRLQSYGAVYADIGGRRVSADFPFESSISSAILQASGGERKRLCFATGHGETDLEAVGPSGAVSAANYLREQLFDVVPVVLSAKADPLPDCDALVVAGPRTVPLPIELDRWNRYLQDGGKAALLFDDPTAAQPLLDDWPVRTTGSVVDDPGGEVLEDPNAVVIGRFPSASPVVEALPPVLFLRPQGLEVTDTSGRGGVSTSTLATSSAPDGPSSATPVAAQVESSKVEGDQITRTRLVVVGDADWISNQGLTLLANLSLLSRMVSWLTLEEPLLAVEDALPDPRAFILISNSDANRLGWVAIAMPPGLIATIGLVVYTWRRRA